MAASLGDAFISWWGKDQVAHLTVSPLTKADIRAAATSELDDPDAFIGAVESRGCMPLAARPITLHLLIAAAARGDPLPARRIEVFSARGKGTAGRT